MNCEQLRDHLMRSDEPQLRDEVARHLAGCARCAEFQRRLDRTRGALRERRTDHQPDAHFARRVAARVPQGTDQLGWAAVRLLPVALALTLVLTAWAWLATPGPSALLERAPTEDLLTWALEDGS